jgi:cellulose synthase/poly-beta-1,6-N-acetylglucosamine synthase-like glycosyltransferase
MKVLIFTPSHYKRGAMLRYTLLDVLNQTYPDFTFALSLKIDDFQQVYNNILIDDIKDPRVVYTEQVNHKICFTHYNAMDTIKSVPNYQDYDLFIKMDDDDIYKKDYVKNVVEFFKNNPDTDIVSSKVNTQLNGFTIIRKNSGYETLGRIAKEDHSNMPMTFAFTKKALDLIINLTRSEIGSDWEDMAWRRAWIKAGLIHKTVDNSEQTIWNVHGKNTTTSGMLIPKN